MNKNDPIEISQVGNGFIVRRPYDIRHGDRMMIAFDEMLVFRTMTELQQWLAEHFTHRAHPKLVDLMPPAKAEKKAA